MKHLKLYEETQFIKEGEYMYCQMDSSYTSQYPILSKFIRNNIGLLVRKSTNKNEYYYVIEYNITNSEEAMENLKGISIKKGNQEFHEIFISKNSNEIKFHSSNYEEVKLYMVSRKYNM